MFGLLRGGVAVLISVLTVGSAAAQQTEVSKASVNRDYVIGIEDVLKIFVWGEPDLTVGVKVRPDGKITVPLVNDIKVVGMTPSEVRGAIGTALATYIRDPTVTVIVEEINSFRVHFLGEINSQGVLQFYRPTRLLQALAAAGGLSDFSKKEITLLRDEFGVEKRIQINYKRLVAGSQGQENIYLKPGDTLVVE